MGGSRNLRFWLAGKVCEANGREGAADAGRPAMATWLLSTQGAEHGVFT
jgi:hypothetical protein